MTDNFTSIIPLAKFPLAAVLAMAMASMFFTVFPNRANAASECMQTMNLKYAKRAWPKTDFSKTSVDLDTICSGGPPKDGIPPIDNPKFVPHSAVQDLPGTEPVIGIIMNGEARAYPLRIMMWHEIVNDEIGGVPVAVTFCPLCNAAIVFDRRLNGKVYDFGTTGNLRKSDLVMYDRQTESWWQQFTGTAIIGEMQGQRLKFLASRLESYANFKARAPNGKVLVANNPGFRNYGYNPYRGYDKLQTPFLYNGEMPFGIAPLARVVTVAGKAWELALLRQKKRIETPDGLIITWQAGQNSALGASTIAEGADVGNVVVQRKIAGKLTDVPYGVDFAFAYHAFHPKNKIVTRQ